MSFEVINPANGQKIETYDRLSDDALQKKIIGAQAEYLKWRITSYSYRASLMYHAAKDLRENNKAYAECMTLEMGKPIQSAMAEVEKCAWVCEYYAENAASFLADEVIPTEAQKSFTHYEPLGVLLAIMPWNFPFWQVFRFAAPALMAGNAVLLKHASNVPGSALMIEKVFVNAGFPAGLFSTLLVGSDKVESIIDHELVKAVTLTGSEKAGSAVASAAGKRIKKTVMELGGSDPYLILEDADLKMAAEMCAKSRLINSGQSCIGAKRFIVLEEVYTDFLAFFKAEMEAAKMGDPMDENTIIGPQARYDLRDDLHRQVTESIKKGAKCILGGEIDKSLKGAYYPATILTDVQPGMPAYEEELFGPVAAVIKVSDEEEAIKVANDTSFGLGAAVFTRNIQRGEYIAATKLNAGCCFVNAFVKSDPRLPFGGIGISGYGRELSYQGIKEFTNIKTIWVA
jgi:succinate-semialdehyde dehydrogenase/glutarate-semialdehyde dehydrogenase